MLDYMKEFFPCRIMALLQDGTCGYRTANNDTELYMEYGDPCTVVLKDENGSPITITGLLNSDI